jgi:hypothetical protein
MFEEEKEIRSKALNARNLSMKNKIIPFIRKFIEPNACSEYLQEKT